MWTFYGISLSSALAILGTAFTAFSLVSLLRVKYRKKMLATTMFWQEALGMSKPKKLIHKFSAFLPWLLMLLLSALACLALLNPAYQDTQKLEKVVYILDCGALYKIKNPKGRNMLEVAIGKIPINSPQIAVIIAGRSPVIVKEFHKTMRKALFAEYKDSKQKFSFAQSVYLAELLLKQTTDLKGEIIIFSDRQYKMEPETFSLSCGLPEKAAPYGRCEFVKKQQGENGSFSAVIAMRQHGMTGRNVEIFSAQSEFKTHYKFSKDGSNIFLLKGLQVSTDCQLKIKLEGEETIVDDINITISNSAQMPYYFASQVPENLAAFLAFLPKASRVFNINDAKLIIANAKLLKANLCIVDKLPLNDKAEYIFWEKAPVICQINDKYFLRKDVFDTDKKLCLQPDFLSFLANNLYLIGKIKMTDNELQSIYYSNQKIKIIDDIKSSGNNTINFAVFIFILAGIIAFLDIVLFIQKRIP